MSEDSRRLKAFLVRAVIWLPLAFLGWAVLSTWLVWLPGALSTWLLEWAWPVLFNGALHQGASWQATTTIMVSQPGGGVGQLVLGLAPMTYGYSLPLFFGLVMATQLGPWQRLRQCAIALPVLWLAQTFGMLAGALKTVQFDSGPAAQAAAQAAGLVPDAVALAYQFGYLILPAVVPALLWVVLNRRFLAGLGRPATEPAGS